MDRKGSLANAGRVTDKALQASQAEVIPEGTLDVVLVAVGRRQQQSGPVKLEGQRTHARETYWYAILARRENVRFIDRSQGTLPLRATAELRCEVTDNRLDLIGARRIR